jgi:hypothetical protein
MNVLFIASMSVVAADPPQSRKLFVDALGLPLEKYDADEYYSSERIPGSKHFGVWPLSQAAEACFGTRRGRPAGWSPRHLSSSRSRTQKLSQRLAASFSVRATSCCTQRAPSRGDRR